MLNNTYGPKKLLNEWSILLLVTVHEKTAQDIQKQLQRAPMSVTAKLCESMLLLRITTLGYHQNDFRTMRATRRLFEERKDSSESWLVAIFRDLRKALDSVKLTGMCGSIFLRSCG
jgi:hypothetical protein